MMSRSNPRKKFVWTEALDQALTRTYQSSKRREELTKGLNHFQRLTGFTRIVITSRAGALGLSFVERRKWTAEELEFVREHAGELSHSAIARRLKRTNYSVKAKVSQLALSLRVREGYSIDDLRSLLGVRASSVRRWVVAGWLRLQNDRVSETSVRQFLFEHPEEYSLRRVDEAWYKGLIFPTFGRSHAFRTEMNVMQKTHSDSYRLTSFAP
jgi:hypothetical protein